MAFKKKTGQYILYAALSALVVFIFLMYTAKPIVGEGRTSCTATEYIKQTAGSIGACPSLCVEEKPRILSSGFCDWTYTCVDSSKCASLPSPAPVTPTGPPNFKVKVLETSNKEYAEKTTITYLIQIENIGGAGVMSVESGMYKEAAVKSWGYTATYAMVSPLTQCVSGETNVQRKAVTLVAGESTTTSYEITIPSYENAQFILIAGSFDKCGEKYQHFDSIPVKIVKSTGGTGGTAGTTTFEWPKITFLSDIGKWWHDRTTLEKSALGAFILLITIWYMFWSEFGKHSATMKALKVQEIRARAEMLTGGVKK